MFRFSILVVLVFASCLLVGESARILGLFPSFSKSHLIVHMSVMKPLIERGHDVTVVTSLPLSDGSSMKIRHIKLDLPPISSKLRGNSMHERKSFLQNIDRTLTFASEVFLQANATLNDPKMKKLMAEEDFDLVVLGYFLNDFLIGVADHFKCPLVISWMNQPFKFINNFVANPIEPIYVPNPQIGMTQPMVFFQRVQNFMVNALESAIFIFVDYKMAKYHEFNFPPHKYRTFDEMKKNVSLVLVNHHLSQGPIRPNVPAIVEIGGIQIKPKSDPLPQDIKNHLDSASENGAIYFCLGSNARSADMKPETISNMIKVLSSLKQQVIWKWEEDKSPANVPNILFKKWLPQDDILAHPNVKLFITHGGLGGIVESEYHGVPMIGIPLIADQFSNMKTIEKIGFGLNLGGKEITEELFRETVLEVLKNPKYSENINEFSKLYRDRPISARDTAVFWIEYVLRHRGAKHMQSPAVHLNTIQYYGLDVISFLFASVYVIFKIIAFVCKKTICRLCRRSRSKSELENKKKRQ